MNPVSPLSPCATPVQSPHATPLAPSLSADRPVMRTLSPLPDSPGPTGSPNDAHHDDSSSVLSPLPESPVNPVSPLSPCGDEIRGGDDHDNLREKLRSMCQTLQEFEDSYASLLSPLAPSPAPACLEGRADASGELSDGEIMSDEEEEKVQEKAGEILLESGSQQDLVQQGGDALTIASQAEVARLLLESGMDSHEASVPSSPVQSVGSPTGGELVIDDEGEGNCPAKRRCFAGSISVPPLPPSLLPGHAPSSPATSTTSSSSFSVVCRPPYSLRPSPARLRPSPYSAPRSKACCSTSSKPLPPTSRPHPPASRPHPLPSTKPLPTTTSDPHQAPPKPHLPSPEPHPPLPIAQQALHKCMQCPLTLPFWLVTSMTQVQSMKQHCLAAGHRMGKKKGGGNPNALILLAPKQNHLNCECKNAAGSLCFVWAM